MPDSLLKWELSPPEPVPGYFCVPERDLPSPVCHHPCYIPPKSSLWGGREAGESVSNVSSPSWPPENLSCFVTVFNRGLVLLPNFSQTCHVRRTYLNRSLCLAGKIGSNGFKETRGNEGSYRIDNVWICIVWGDETWRGPHSPPHCHSSFIIMDLYCFSLSARWSLIICVSWAWRDIFIPIHTELPKSLQCVVARKLSLLRLGNFSNWFSQ